MDMNIKHFLTKALPHVCVALFFFLLVFFYFQPAFDGKTLQQSDITHLDGVAQEVLEYGERTGWTGSQFSGMPTYQTTGYDTGINLIKQFYGFIYSETGGAIFFFLLSSYILFLVLGAPWWLSALGAVAMAFQSYNFILLIAGHITKIWVLAFVPLVLAGLSLVFKKKYWLGLIAFTLGLSLMIIINHLQITYYVAIFCLILFIAFVVNTIIKKEYKHLGLAIATLFVGVSLVVLSNLSSLYINYESGQESIRGKTELTPIDSDSRHVSEGLDKDYAFAWSYGISETYTMLVPNVKGGASGGTLGKDSHLYKELKSKGAQIGKEIQAPTYWGEKAFTSGPVYFGAIICLLFFWSFFIVKGKSKWWLLGAAVFFIFLSWGRNFSIFNDFMFYYFPLYNKFRTVEMALVIPGFIFPIMGVLAIKELINTKIDTKQLINSLLISTGVVGGICFLFWLMPGAFFTFESSYDAQYGMPDWYYDAVIADRKDLLKADALRSLMFIVLAAGIIFGYLKIENKKKVMPYMMAGLVILVLVDLWQVDKRYLNNDNFVDGKNYNKQVFEKTIVDKAILEDTSESYRVLNLNNTFQDSRTSYYHKSIGGYSAAKLGRYQDLIDRQLIPEVKSVISSLSTATSYEDLSNALANCSSLNMLNAKYVIYNTNQAPIYNPNAYGNAWFVNSYRFVDTPDEEMQALNSINTKSEAVLDIQFKDNIKGLDIVPDENATIELTAYYPNKLEYISRSSKDGLAVFSEIYYKNGWKAYIDGEQVPISRADWTLRAIVIPAGEHKIFFEFSPDNINMFGRVSSVFSILLVILMFVGLGLTIYRRK
ncbi:hypothetical protein M2138_001647 [Dysgonomonadaceae bacterium PH5-43]|nr:hypothetical protein [Dysgonomonadaceae bacterium PH5-43]